MVREVEGHRVRLRRSVVGPLGLVLVLGIAGCERNTTPRVSIASPEIAATTESVQPTAPTAKPLVNRVPVARPALLQAAQGGDGDSWRDTRGAEYRLGLVNAPEASECYGSAATAKREELVAGGFRATVYATDGYGRSVSVVTLADETNLNVWLARHGYVNDKYLAKFRHENLTLASKLDVAFAAAKRERAGLWRACAAPAAAPVPVQAFVQPPSSGSSCHPDYVTCIPAKGDGSGAGSANDLDCPDIGRKVTLRHSGVDPYRLDSDGDGFGCDSY